MLKVVIFDFDGVVSDSEPLHYKAINEVLLRYGIRVSKEEHWEKYLGYNDYENITVVSQDYGAGFSDQQVSDMIQEKAEIFEKLVNAETTIIAGVPEFIEMLQANSIRLAICSGASRVDIDLMLAGSGLERVFETIVSADDVSKSKPDPEGFLLTLGNLNRGGSEQISPDECVVIEDSHWGLEAAIAAGMHKIAVTNSYPAAELAKFTEKVVSRLDELTIEDLQALCIER